MVTTGSWGVTRPDRKMAVTTGAVMPGYLFSDKFQVGPLAHTEKRTTLPIEFTRAHLRRQQEKHTGHQGHSQEEPNLLSHREMSRPS